MATWTPDPAIIPWLEVVANATFVAAPIVAIDENGTPASHYDFEIVGPRPKIIGLQVSQVGSRLTERNLNIQPTLEIRPGYRFNVIVTKDLVFKEPYREQ